MLVSQPAAWGVGHERDTRNPGARPPPRRGDRPEDAHTQRGGEDPGRARRPGAPERCPLGPRAGSGPARQRFSREARAAAAVVHDNVIEIYGVAEARGLPYLVMPYVRGTSLQRRLDESGPLTVLEVLRIGLQAAAGLAARCSERRRSCPMAKTCNILPAGGLNRWISTSKRSFTPGSASAVKLYPASRLKK